MPDQLDDDFEPEDIQVLEEEGLILGPVIDGRRKVNLTALFPHIAVPPASPCEIRTADLPIAGDSSAALEFMGFTPHAAQEIFACWAARPDPDTNLDEVLHYAYSHVLSKDPREMFPSRAAMASMGLTATIQDALLDPQPPFAHIQPTQTLHFWIREALRLRYYTLLGLHTCLRDAAERIRATEKPRPDD